MEKARGEVLWQNTYLSGTHKALGCSLMLKQIETNFTFFWGGDDNKPRSLQQESKADGGISEVEADGAE